MEPIIGIIALVLSVMCLVALLVVLGELFPDAIAGAARASEATPGRAILIGAVNAGFLFAIVAALGASSEQGGGPVVGLLALLGIIAGAILAGLGLASMIAMLGQRVWPGRAKGRFARRGGAACSVPRASHPSWAGSGCFRSLCSLVRAA